LASFLAVSLLGSGNAEAVAAASSLPYDPPLFRYRDGQIDVLEAVRLALENDPKLRLKQADARFREGVAEELRGAFDWVLKGELVWDYREQELTDSVKKTEIDKRRKAEINERDTCNELARQRQILQALRTEAASPGDPVIFAPPDLSLEKQLQFFDLLLANASDPVARQGILDQKISFLQTQIAAREVVVANLERGCVQAGIDRQRLGKAPEFEYFEQAKVDLRATKTFRSGVVLTPFLTGQFDKTQFKGKRNGPEEQIFLLERDANGQLVEVPLTTSLGPVTRTIDFGGKGVKDLYQSAVGFELNIPMLRGRGEEAVAARERAALRDAEAAALAAKQAAAETVIRTVSAYWNLHAAQERVKVLTRALELERRLVEITRALIEAQEMPRAELARVLAAEANAQSQLDAAQRELVKARMELALALGIRVESEENAPLASGPFPPAPDQKLLSSLTELDLANLALSRRFDLRAALLTRDARQLEARGAELDRRAKLDLGLTLSSRAIGEDSFSNAVDQWASPSWRVKLASERPIGNRERQGRFLQAKARLDQSAIESADLERNIRLNVVLVQRSLAAAVGRYEAAKQAVEHYTATVEAELEKLRLGSATLLDAIVTEQQQTQAGLALIAAKQELATLIAQLRFETGTLLNEHESSFEVLEENLTHLPQAREGGE
jgi:outer membrane protein TolC